MKTKLFLILFFLTYHTHSFTQNTISRDSLIEDFKQLTAYLEETHPDPYIGFGGKVRFHKEVSTIIKNLSKHDYSFGEFTEIASGFLSSLEDGHTYVYQNMRDMGSLLIPANLRVVSDGIILTSLPDTLKTFLGSKLLGINGQSIDELCEKTKKIASSENIYGRRNHFARNMPWQKFQKQLIKSVGEIDTLLIETPEGKQQNLLLPFIPVDSFNVVKWELCPVSDKVFYVDDLSYSFLDKECQTMYFRLKSVMAREAFLYMYKQNHNGVEFRLKNYYQNMLKREMPEQIEKAIAGVPALSEVFQTMLKTMKKSKTSNLIIDLRDNGGGYTSITLPTLYQMYGDSLLKTDMGIQFCRVISPLYLQKNNMTLEEYNTKFKTKFQLGDYIMNEEEPEKKDLSQMREEFVNGTMGDVSKMIKNQNGVPVYTPERIFVITNSNTFSAAFHYAFYLWKMGATVIGVPSCQAPNAFMEVTNFRLKHTGLEGSISNSAQYFLSPADKRAKVFYPEIMLNYEDYKRYHFDYDTEILFLLNYIKNGYQ